jgi:hypothetical protein
VIDIVGAAGAAGAATMPVDEWSGQMSGPLPVESKSRSTSPAVAPEVDPVVLVELPAGDAP